MPWSATNPAGQFPDLSASFLQDYDIQCKTELDGNLLVLREEPDMMTRKHTLATP